jgi:hypothetical protein
VGIKGLIRDSVMFAVGILLLLNLVENQTAGIVLIVVAIVFTVLAWLKLIKGW